MAPPRYIPVLFVFSMAAMGAVLYFSSVRFQKVEVGPQLPNSWFFGSLPNAGLQRCTALPRPRRVQTGLGAIVMAFTLDRRTDPSTLAVLHNWQTYADMHGYHIVPSWINMTHYPAYSSFYTARWAHVLHSPHLWERYDWFLHVDGDTLVYNLSIPLTRYLQPGVDVVLQVRENAEVSAAASLWRTTPFSRCFIDYFAHRASWSGGPVTANWDNGDLIQALLDLVDPDLAAYCEAFRNDSGPHYGTHFVPCFSRAMWRLTVLHLVLPIRLYWPLEGVWRSHEGLEPEWRDDVQLMIQRRCWSNDFLIHGWKQMPTEMWVQRNGTTPRCYQSTRGQELIMAQRCCFWHYPGCWEGKHNQCRHQSHCWHNQGTFHCWEKPHHP